MRNLITQKNVYYFELFLQFLTFTYISYLKGKTVRKIWENTFFFARKNEAEENEAYKILYRIERSSSSPI
jgi:hypothetical protein